MIRIFRALPPKMQAWFLDHFWLIPAVIIVSIGVIVFIWKLAPDPYRVVHATQMPVIGSMDTSGDSGFSTAFLVSLPDGNTARVSTDSLILAQTIVDTACVQSRAHESGKLSYVLVAPTICE
ncbi:MAG: hypothetical protein ABJ370_10620 [Paracoccaceae bacterium]